MKIFQCLIFVALVSYIHCYDLNTTMLDVILEKCAFLQTYNKLEVDHFKKQPVFEECKNWTAISALTSVLQLSDENKNNIRCLLYYESFVPFCNNLTVSSFKTSRIDISAESVGSRSVEYVCQNSSALPKKTNQSQHIHDIIKNAKACIFLCSEYKEGNLNLNIICAKSYYYNNFGFENHHELSIVTPKPTSVNMDKKQSINETNKPGEVPAAVSNISNNISSNKLLKNAKQLEENNAMQLEEQNAMPLEEQNAMPLEEQNAMQLEKKDEKNVINDPIQIPSASNPTGENQSHMDEHIEKSEETKTISSGNVELPKDSSINAPKPEVAKIPEENHLESVHQVGKQDINIDNNVNNAANNLDMEQEEMQVNNVDKKPNSNEDIFNDDNPKMDIPNTGPQYVDIDGDNTEKLEVEKQEGMSDKFKAPKASPLDDPYSYTADMDGNSYFFTYFSFICVAFVVGYVGYHNKQKVLAILVEGRSSRRPQRGRRPNSANYHKLDSNLEEAISSSCSKNPSHIIY